MTAPMTTDPAAVEAMVGRLANPLPVCPFDRRSPDYWTTGNNGEACHVCGGTEEVDRCKGADTRVMDEAAAMLTALSAENEALKADVSEIMEANTEALTEKAALSARVVEMQGALDGLIIKWEAGEDHDEGAFDSDCDICLFLADLRRFRARTLSSAA